MAPPNTAQPDTLAGVKDEAKKFNAKLRRVLRDKPAQELADLMGVKVQSIYQYKSRGFQFAPYQVPKIAKYAGCSSLYLIDDSIPVDADPRTAVDLGNISDEAIVAELKKRLVAIGLRLEDLIDRAEGYPWEAVAAWLLSRFIAPKPESDFVLAGLQLFKDIEPKAARFMRLSLSAAPAFGNVIDLEDGMAVHLNVRELVDRSESLRERHPGIQAISHYLCWFDPDWHPGAGFPKPPAKPTPDWDDRRAWLMAQLVTHDDLKDEPIYDPIRDRLREMNYIDAEGKPRDYVYSKDGLGDFDLPEPGWDN